MKKTIIFLLFITSFSYYLVGQKLVLELEMKGGKAQNVLSTSDRYGNMTYIFQGTKSFQLSILDINYNVTKEFLIDRSEAEKKNVIIGATLSAENVVLYLYDHKEGNIASLVVDRNLGTYKFNPSIASIAKTEYLLKSFEMEGIFYLMVVPEHKNSVLLFSSTEGNDFVLKNYEINFPTFYAKLSSKNESLNQKTDLPIGIEKISYTVENNIKSAYPTKKMYTYGNKIYLTFEEPAHTHLVIIDPNSTAAIYRKLNFSLDKGKDVVPRQGNSFLYKGDLFRVTMSKDQLNLIVINLDSMEMLKSYNVFPDQPISFINGSIREDGSSGNEAKILKNTQSYFKKLQKGELGIAVNELANRIYETEVGAYEEFTSYRNTPSGGIPLGNSRMSLSFGMGMGGLGMSGIGMGMGGLGMGYGGMMGGYGYGYPGYYPYGGDFGSTSILVTYFQSLLNVEDLSHVPGNVPKTIREKISEYEESVLKNTDPESLNLLPSYNGVVLGYYAKGRSRYNLVEFLK